jgi:hypothetical protein
MHKICTYAQRERERCMKSLRDSSIDDKRRGCRCELRASAIVSTHRWELLCETQKK